MNTDSMRDYYGPSLLLAAFAFCSVTFFSPDASAGRGYIQYVDDQSRGHKVGEIHLYIRPAFGVSSTYLDALDAAGDLFAGLQSDPPECFTPDYQSAYLFSDGKHNDGGVQPDEGASRLDSLGLVSC